MTPPEPSAIPQPPEPSADQAPQTGPGPATLLGAGNALPLGHRLHEFEITGLVGEGGFGIVYLARDTALQRTVAIKEYMPASLAARGQDHSVSVRSERHRETFALGLRSFVNEARLLASFDHPALVKVYRFWEDNGTAYMVMPYYQGPTLKASLRELGHAPDEAWLKALLHPLLDALAIIHADAVFHRDIAPDNILLLGPTKPLLLDFGAARRVIGDATQALTVILKPGYAPVEQYAEVPSMKQGPWTDVYALCAVLYAAITGKAPPPSVGRLMKDELVPLSQVAAGRYSAPFLAAIDAGLTVHPDQRPHDIAALRERLFAAHLPEPAPASSTPLPPDEERTVLLPAQADGAGHTAFPATVMAPAPAGSGSAGAQQAQATPPAQANGPSGGARRPLILGGMGAGLLALAGGWWAIQHRQVGEPPASTAASTPGLPTPTQSPSPSTSAPATTAAAAPEQTASASASAPTTLAAPVRPPFSIQAALDDIIAQADPQRVVTTLPNQSRLVIGKDRLLFRVKSSQPGYVYVYLAGTDAAHFYLLFPNALDQRNRIEADRVIELPRKGWSITAGGPPGINRIVTVVSPTPRDLGALGLNTRDSIPEFDLAQAARLWASHSGQGSPFVGPPACEPGLACDAHFGAAQVEIEEVRP